MKIKLQHGHEVEIDDEDYEKVKGYGWYADFISNVVYARSRLITPDGKHTTILMHRLIMGQPTCLVDHIDRNGLNNKKSNLRLADRRGNSANCPGRKNSKSKFKGVTWDSEKKKWLAQIAYDGKNHYIGRFISEKEAALAYNEKAKLYFGEFAYINTF